jgi:hypothetical protein
MKKNFGKFISQLTLRAEAVSESSRTAFLASPEIVFEFGKENAEQRYAKMLPEIYRFWT